MARSFGSAAYRSGHVSIPIVPQFDARLTRTHRDRLDALATQLIHDEPALAATDFFGAGVACGLTEAPVLVYEDHREIALFSPKVGTAFEYRSLLLAGDGDMVVLSGTPDIAFESYCHDSLALGTPEFLRLSEDTGRRYLPLAERCLATPALMERLCDICRQNYGLDILPYLGRGTAWKLASAIAARTGSPVHVAAPPPRLTQRVNDKVWFTEQVRKVLNRGSLPPSYSVFGPAALAGRIAAIARRFPQVIVKVPDSAGSQGNVRIHSADIEGWPVATLRQWILDSLRARGWSDIYPLLVGVWESAVLQSPSVNLWVPSPDDGLPVIEGIFVQTLQGPEGTFIGAEPSDLPKAVETRLADGALALGYLLQRLGYFGRCGFDAVLVGSSIEDAEIHWIECNGRWGGVSTPMTLANRLAGNWRSKGLVIVQQSRLDLSPRSFDETLRLLGERLLTRPGTSDGVVLLSPERIVSGSGLNFMVIARDQERARNDAQAALSLLLS